jgi:hypothetical protein
MIWGKQSTAAVPALPGGMLLLLAGLLLLVGYWMGRRRRAPRWMALGIGLGVALLPIAIVHATSTFGVPNTFANGTVADATQVNANFTAVVNEINALRNQTSVLTDCDFKARTSTQSVSCGSGGGGATLAAPGDDVLMAPVRVPSGATLTGADVWVQDSNASVNVKVCVWAPLDNLGTYDMGSFTCATTSGSPGIVKLTLSAIGSPIQGNNESFEYIFIAVDASGNPTSWPTDFTLFARTAYTHYQLP